MRFLRTKHRSGRRANFVRLWRPYTIVPLLSILLVSMVAVSAQGVRYADPPITTIELTGFEPLPSGVPTDILYGGLGGGGGPTLLQPGIYWERTPGAVATAADPYFSACGYSSSTTPPSVILTSPSGAQVSLAVELSDYESICYFTTIEWQYGIELGIYSIQFNHPEGNLAHTFGYDYPICWYEYVGYLEANPVEWLMGFQPDEQLTLLFYAQGESTEYEPAFVATRNVRADEDGVVALDIQIGRTAPFERHELFYATTGVGRIIYPTNPALETDAFESAGFVLATSFTPPPSTYPHNETLYGSFFGSDARGIPCDGEFARFVQVYPRPAGVGSLTLYQGPNNAGIVTSLAAGSVAEVIDTQPAITNGRVAAWKLLRTEDGMTGWTASVDLVDLQPYARPGVRAEVRPIGTETSVSGVYTPASPPLFNLPEGQITGEVIPGTEVTLLENRVVNDLGWWRVRFRDGREGWMYEYDPNSFIGGFDALAWRPVEDAGVVSTGDTEVRCPGSPPSRLVIGGIGRVLPGDPNRLRAAPETGEVLGNIPGEATFTVLDGPVCGEANGLAWWRVNYAGTVGWTAEGQGRDYWLEMAN